MSVAKLALWSSLAGLAVAGCGGTAIHPGPPAPPGSSRGRVDDPRTSKSDHVQCMRDKGLPVQEFGQAGIQIGPAPSGPRVLFTPSPGAAQGDQIEARVQGAEVIGSALLYPDQGSDSELNQIETCLTQGVSG